MEGEIETHGVVTPTLCKPSEIGGGVNVVTEKKGIMEQAQERVRRLLHPESKLFRPLTDTELTDLREIDPGGLTSSQVSQEARQAAVNQKVFLKKIFGDNLTEAGKQALSKRQREETIEYDWIVKMIRLGGGKYSELGGYLLDHARAWERVVAKTEAEIGALQTQQEASPTEDIARKIEFHQRTIADCSRNSEEALKRAAFFARQVK